MRVAFSWSRLPQYAAREIRCAIDRVNADCVVIGSAPVVPIRGMEEALGCPIHWVDRDADLTWKQIGTPPPDLYFQSGWSFRAFSSLGREVKANGGAVVGLSDSNWRGDFRQLVLGPIAFRILHRSSFDGMLVPGRQGVRLMRWFGVPPERIRSGMYGADPAIFGGGSPLASRAKTFLFVGQFIERKNVLALARAFIDFARENTEWTLRLCGSGVLRTALPEHERIFVEDFVQPSELAKRYQECRFFILPSLTEAWGLVVHEAALSGCGLILSDAVGSADDLATRVNAITFQRSSETALLGALRQAAAFNDAQLDSAELESRRLAEAFGPERFAEAVCGFVEALRGERCRSRGAT